VIEEINNRSPLTSLWIFIYLSTIKRKTTTFFRTYYKRSPYWLLVRKHILYIHHQDRGLYFTRCISWTHCNIVVFLHRYRNYISQIYTCDVYINKHTSVNKQQTNKQKQMNKHNIEKKTKKKQTKNKQTKKQLSTQFSPLSFR